MTIIIAFLSAFIGGSLTLLGVYLTNKANIDRLLMQFVHEKHQRREDVLRARGEELYELTDKWLKSLFGYYMRRSLVMQEKLTYNECYELDIKDGRDNYLKFGRIEMLIDVYFPSTRPAFDKIIDGRTELNKIGIQHHRAYEAGDTDVSRFLAPYLQCQRSIEQAGESFKIQVLNCLQSL